MKKITFLTSALLMTMISTSFADIANNAESATCDSTTIGVSNGSTVLEAQWNAQSITCPSGTYLEADDATCTACPTGSYCAGATYTFNGSDLGITGACESGYTTDGSASAQSDCYRACTTDDIAHSTAVSGKYYYGDNNQCEPTDCAEGYTVKEGLDLSVYINQNLTTSTYGFVRASNSQYGTGGTDSAQTKEYFDISNANTWGNDFGYGIGHGQARCSTEVGTNDGYASFGNATTFATLVDKTGQEGAKYCYCNITGFKVNNDTYWTNLSSDWVFNDSFNSASDCSANCAAWCAHRVGFGAGFRETLFNTIKTVLDTCSANTIGITWKPQNGEANTVNQCTYNGAVTIPATPSKVGYDFAGWHVNNAQ